MSQAEEARRQRVDWRSVAAGMAHGTRRAIARFPITALFLLLPAINASLLIEEHGLFSDGKNDFVVPFLGGALASLAASLFWESRTRDPWVRHCGAIIAAVFAFALLWLHAATHTIEWVLLLALVGLVPVSPYIGRGSAAAFWLFAVRLGVALLLAWLALLLFAGGISAILASLTYLFGVAVPERLYSHIWAIAAIFAAPLFGLGQIPRNLGRAPDVDGRTYGQRGVRALGEFVAVPLLLAYALILHAYALKIAVTQEVPQGQVGWLVLAFGMSVIGSLVVCRPFMRPERAPTAFFLRIWPFILVVPIALLAYALYLRIGAYGITPDRYLLALFGLVLAILVALQRVPSLRGDIRLMVVVPAVALLLASFGPQGASSISLRSQIHRFLAIVNDPAARETRADEALEALRYISANDGLIRVTPEGFDPSDTGVGEYRAIARAWGINPDRDRRGADRFFSLTYPQQEAVGVALFDLVVPDAGLIAGQRKPVTVTLPEDKQVELSLREGAFRVARENGQGVTFTIDPARVTAILESGTGTTPRIVLESDGKRVMLAPSFLYGIRAPQPEIRNFAGAIFLRSEDWD
jgi:hypothetical protein